MANGEARARLAAMSPEARKKLLRIVAKLKAKKKAAEKRRQKHPGPSRRAPLVTFSSRHK